MLQRLARVPIDTFLLALLAVVALAALFPASGTVGDLLSIVTKVAIALLFFLYGARLSPTEAMHGLRRWRLHLLVLAATFVAFPLLGLAASALVPSVLTPGLYTGVLFLCLVPSTVQSSIAFTSIAHGNVPAAIVSASLSNILGIVLTPLLVVLLMHTTGAPRIDASAVLDIVLQLLLPFVAGQLLRRWLAPWVHRHALVTKAFDRGSILLVVYTAFSMSMTEHIWSTVSPWRAVAVAVCGAVGDHARGHGRHVAARPAESGRRRGGAVLRLQEEPGVRPSDGAGVLRHRGSWPDHVAADDLSPDPAVRLRGHRDPMSRTDAPEKTGA